MAELNLEALEMRYAKLRARQARQEARLLLSIQEHGQQNPICVVEESEGRYVVIDGHKRVRALYRLKRDVAKAMVMKAPAEEALVSAYQSASGSGWTALEEGWLTHELHRVKGWDLSKVAAGLDRSKSWVSRRMGLVERLPEGVQSMVQAGKLGAHAAMKHLLPLARANARGCERLAEKISEAQLTSRQMEVVCRHYGAGKSKAADRILEDPVQFLKALEAAKQGEQEAGLSEGENRVWNNLELVGNVCLGLVRLWPQAMNYDTPEAARKKLGPQWRRVRERWELLEKAVEASGAMEKEHVGSRAAGGDREAASTGAFSSQDCQGFGSQPQQREGGAA